MSVLFYGNDEDVDHLLVTCLTASILWELLLSSFTKSWTMTSNIKEVFDRDSFTEPVPSKAKLVLQPYLRLSYGFFEELRFFKNKVKDIDKMLVCAQELVYDWSEGNTLFKHRRVEDFIVEWDSTIV